MRTFVPEGVGVEQLSDEGWERSVGNPRAFYIDDNECATLSPEDEPEYYYPAVAEGACTGCHQLGKC